MAQVLAHDFDQHGRSVLFDPAGIFQEAIALGYWPFTGGYLLFAPIRKNSE